MRNVGQTTINKCTIFLDTNILFSANYTTLGASHSLVAEYSKHLHIATSEQCVKEASISFQNRYKKHLKNEVTNHVIVYKNINVSQEFQFNKFVNDKNDSHVIASAYHIGAKYLGPCIDN